MKAAQALDEAALMWKSEVADASQEAARKAAESPGPAEEPAPASQEMEGLHSPRMEKMG